MSITPYMFVLLMFSSLSSDIWPQTVGRFALNSSSRNVSWKRAVQPLGRHSTANLPSEGHHFWMWTWHGSRHAYHRHFVVRQTRGNLNFAEAHVNMFDLDPVCIDRSMRPASSAEFGAPNELLLCTTAACHVYGKTVRSRKSLQES